MTRTLELTDREWAILGFSISYAIVMSVSDPLAQRAWQAHKETMVRLNERLFEKFAEIAGDPTPNDVEEWLKNVE